MGKIDPLGRDALLVVYGVTLGALLGVALRSGGTPLSPSAVVVGAALPLLLAAGWWCLRGHVSVPAAWQPWHDRGRRGRLAMAGVFALVLGFRFVFPFLPRPFQDQFTVATAAASLATAGIGMGLTVRRLLVAS